MNDFLVSFVIIDKYFYFLKVLIWRVINRDFREKSQCVIDM